MKKKIILISTIIIIILGILFFLSGRARTDVYLKDFMISEDGTTMTLEIAVANGKDHIRTMKQTSGSTNYYFTFYSTFGINSKLGAKETFTIDLDNNADAIYFYTGKKGYKQVLQKDEATGEWLKVVDKSDKKVQRIVDKTTEIADFACAQALEEFYEDEKFIYYYSCMKGRYMIVEYTDGTEETIAAALANGHITINDLDNYDIKYHVSEK